MIFSGRAAHWGRRWRWLSDGVPLLVGVLPLLVTLVLLPIYLITTAGLFLALDRHTPEVVQTNGLAGALLLTVDVVLQAAVFFDLFEVFHLRAANDPVTWSGSAVLFAVRIILDVVLIEVFARTLYAAMYRVKGLGRGEDKLFRLKESLETKDPIETRSLSETIGGSLRS